MKKKIVCLALALVFVASLLPLAPNALAVAAEEDYGWPDMEDDVEMRVTQNGSEMNRLIVGEIYQVQIWMQNVGPYSISIPIGWNPDVAEVVDPKTELAVPSGKKEEGEPSGFRAGSKCYETGYDMLTYEPLYWNGRPVYTRNEEDPTGGYPYLNAEGGCYAFFYYVSSPNAPAQAQLILEVNFRILESGDPNFHIASSHDRRNSFDPAEPEGISAVAPNGDEGAETIVYGTFINCPETRALTREENEEELKVPVDIGELPITGANRPNIEPDDSSQTIWLKVDLIDTEHLDCFPYDSAAETAAVIKNVEGEITWASDYILPLSLVSDILNGRKLSEKRSILVNMPDERIDKDEYALVFSLSNIDDMANNGLSMLYVETPWAYVGLNTAILANKTADDGQARLSVKENEDELDISFSVDGEEIKSLGGMMMRVIVPYDFSALEEDMLPVPMGNGFYGGLYNSEPMSFYKQDTDHGVLIFLSPVFASFQVEQRQMEQFADMTEARWAEEYVGKLAQRGVVNGVGNGCFAPNSPVTREQFTVMVVRALGMYSAAPGEEIFSDASTGNYFTPYLSSAYNAGLVYGVGNGVFGVGQHISRQDLTVLCYRALTQLGATLPRVRDEVTFADDGEIAGYAREAVTAFYCAGLIDGMGNDTFAPRAEATRAQAAKIVCNMITQALQLL